MIPTSGRAWITLIGSELYPYFFFHLSQCLNDNFGSYYFCWCASFEGWKILHRYYIQYVFCVPRNARRSIKLDNKGDSKGSKKWKQQSLKYTAARLHEKGVILEIEGLQINQWVEDFVSNVTPPVRYWLFINTYTTCSAFCIVRRVLLLLVCITLQHWWGGGGGGAIYHIASKTGPFSIQCKHE